MRDHFDLCDVDKPRPLQVEDEEDRYFFPGYWLIPALVIGIFFLYAEIRLGVWIIARVF